LEIALKWKAARVDRSAIGQDGAGLEKQEDADLMGWTTLMVQWPQNLRRHLQNPNGFCRILT